MTRIVLVDDHAMLRDGLRSVLAAAGHEVVGESADPTDALARIGALAPAVVLLDLHLRERSGFELLDALQRRASPARCIVLTMSAQPHHVAEALRLGAAGYLLKGSDASELLRAVDAVAAGGRFLGSDVAALAQRPPDDDQAALASLSVRERQIVTLVVRGHSSTQIGSQLHLSPKTVDSYRSRLMAKLGVGDVPALVRLAIRAGLVDAHER